MAVSALNRMMVALVSLVACTARNTEIGNSVATVSTPMDITTIAISTSSSVAPPRELRIADCGLRIHRFPIRNPKSEIRNDPSSASVPASAPACSPWAWLIADR